MEQYVIHFGEPHQIFEFVELLPNEKLDYNEIDLNLAEKIMNDLRIELSVKDIFIKTNELEFFPFLAWIIARTRMEREKSFE